jgi:hypothetical protein
MDSWVTRAGWGIASPSRPEERFDVGHAGVEAIHDGIDLGPKARREHDGLRQIRARDELRQRLG